MCRLPCEQQLSIISGLWINLIKVAADIGATVLGYLGGVLVSDVAYHSSLPPLLIPSIARHSRRWFGSNWVFYNVGTFERSLILFEVIIRLDWEPPLWLAIKKNQFTMGGGTSSCRRGLAQFYRTSVCH